MTNRLTSFLIASALVSPVSASQDMALDDQAIRTLVVGKTLLGTYPDGVPWRETYLVDEGVDYQDPDMRLTGSWYAADNALCTFYDEAGDFEGGCFMVVVRSANCIDFYAINADDQQPNASPNDIALGFSWTARGWRSDQPSTCPEDMTS